MGLIDTLHEKHKQRQQRIKQAAYQPPPEPVAKISEIKHEIDELKIKPAMDVILYVICKHYGVSAPELLSRRRNGKLAEIRQMFMFFANRMTFLTFGQIANRIDRDPSTVKYAVAKIKNISKKYEKDIYDLDFLIREAFTKRGIPCRKKT